MHFRSDLAAACFEAEGRWPGNRTVSHVLESLSDTPEKDQKRVADRIFHLVLRALDEANDPPAWFVSMAKKTWYDGGLGYKPSRKSARRRAAS